MAFSLLLLGCANPAAVAGEDGISVYDAVAHLPPGEQFRQLSLMLLIAVKAGPEFTTLLAAEASTALSQSSANGPSSDIRLDDYRTPLVRIVDQKSMLNGAIQLFAFVQQNLEDISDSLQTIRKDNPVLISMVDTQVIMEDAIIIRTAVADSVVFLDYAGGNRMSTLLGAYRVHTVFLRNQLEYADFYAELEKLTDTAVNSVGGKMDAYQRMFDEEFETDSVEKFMEATEFSIEKQAIFDRRAAMLTEEIMQSVMDAMQPEDP